MRWSLVPILLVLVAVATFAHTRRDGNYLGNVRSNVYEWAGFNWAEANDDGDCMVSTMRAYDNARVPGGTHSTTSGWNWDVDVWDSCAGNTGRWDRQHTLPVYQATKLREMQCVINGLAGLTSTDTIEIQPVFNAGTSTATNSMTITSADTAPIVRTVDLDETPIYVDVRLRVDKVGSAGTVTGLDIICTLVVEF